MVLDLPDPDPSLFVWIWILPSSSKKIVRKTLIPSSTVLWLLYDFIFEEWLKHGIKQKNLEKRSLTKRAGSGAGSGSVKSVVRICGCHQMSRIHNTGWFIPFFAEKPYWPNRGASRGPLYLSNRRNPFQVIFKLNFSLDAVCSERPWWTSLSWKFKFRGPQRSAFIWIAES